MDNTIIKKALNEALTQQYYDELMKCGDEEHTFSVGFTADMKRLIRKTDDKILYYSKYVAIAACACIAIGCAVLLPNLINSGIRTETSETTTVTETATAPDETVPVTTTTTTNADFVPSVVPDTTTLDTDSAGPVEITTQATTTETITETTTPPVTTTEEKVTETDEKDEVIDDAEVEGEIIDDDTDADTDGDVIVDVEDDGGEAPPEIEEGDDDAVVDDDADDTVVEEDDDVEIEDDSDDVTTDSDDDDVIEEDAVEEDDDDTPPKPFESDTLGGAIAELMFDDPEANIDGRIYTNKLTYMVPNDDGASSLYNLYSTTQNLDFVTEFIIKNKDSVVPAEVREEDYWNDHLIIYIANGPVKDMIFNDYSDRNQYDVLFGGEDCVDVEAEDSSSYTRLQSIKVYQSGIISVYGSGYSTTYFEADTSELFEKLESLGFSKEPKTVGDIISDSGITSDNIYKAYANIKDFYDIGLNNAKFDTESDKAMLISFLEKIKDKKLTANTDYVNEYDSCNIRISFKDYGALRMCAYKGKLYFADRIEAPEKWYSTPITQSELEELITITCKAENVSEPSFYHTFGEYREQVKYMTVIENAYINEHQSGVSTSYKITDSEKLKALYDYIMVECESAEYKPYAEVGRGKKTFFVEMNGSAALLFNDSDEIRILGNIFQCSAGTYNRVMEYIKNNSTISAEDYMEEDVIVDDDTDDFVIEIEDAIEE